MSSRPRPPIPRGLTHTDPDQVPIPDKRPAGRPDLNRPLPAPPLSLPNDYEIPSLRSKPLPDDVSQNQLGHTRSLSHPFPLFFGGKRSEKKPTPRDDEIDSSEDGSLHPTGSGSKIRIAQRNGSKRVASATKQPATGKCMTCDSTVRWPQDLKVFRCSTCLTINDLEPPDGLRQAGQGQTTVNGAHRKPMPVSLERTRKMIDYCIDDYLKHVLETGVSSKPREPVMETFFLSDDEALETTLAASPAVLPGHGRPTASKPGLRDRVPSNPMLPFLSPSRGRQENQGQDVPPRTPTRSDHNQQNGLLSLSHDANLQYAEADIFRSVESYLAGSLTGCTSLNISFFSIKPMPQREDKHQERQHIRPQPSETPGTPAYEPEAFLSELDAKTLLLGDVAENGSWWTGKIDVQEEAQTENTRDKSPERWRGVVSARTPRINWLELAEWYRLILHAGDDWRRRWMSLGSTLSSENVGKWQSIPMETLHRHVMQSQNHLQRSFLKATENLLKRPRRPLKSPEDCRFLLMLLANPLLSSVHRDTASRAASDGAVTSTNGQLPGDSPARAARPRRNYSGLGRHSGIVKRILGLIAHLPNDVHLYLVSWFSRLSDGHFAGMVDLVGSFVTYRLTRQLNKPTQEEIDPTEGLIPSFTDGGARHVSQMHAALSGRSSNTQKQKELGRPRLAIYGEDWQVRAAARVMALFFQSNTGHTARKRDTSISVEQRARSAGLSAKHAAYMHGQMIPISNFYNSMLDHADLIADFEAWEMTKTKFTFCQYPFFLSIWAKIHILEHDAKRQMESKAREAFFDSILSRKAVSQYLVLRVRRDCLVDDSLKNVSEAIGRGGQDVKKGLRIDFVGEEGVDAGGLRKEWFLLLVREIFNPAHGLFSYDDESQYCYFNPFCFESSEQFFLVGVLLGLAIYNSTILDVAFPPFLFKKMLASAPSTNDKLTSTPKISHQYSLEDLAELKPSLARGLRQLLEYEGDVQETYCRDFLIEMERYGGVVQIPLCSGGSKRPVTNANRREFVDMYVHYLLDQSVARQYEPFKRGFFTVCGGNALSLFRPEEIELLVRGSDEPLDVNSLRLVASYDGWPKEIPAQEQPQLIWFWEFFERLPPADQRKMLGFITGSDRIPAMGATNLVIRIQLLLDKVAEDNGTEPARFPIARTCFNLLGLYRYQKRITLEEKLWSAVTMSEGFGMK
ncbi:putative E3 ubiquitin-protein ligase [Lithohypha guttulata]|nr:putative E3 ubiquitin-protein ligase [Lithohypha guttulata]